MEVAQQYEAGKQLVAQNGCLACHTIGDNGNGTLGPELTEIGAQIPRSAILRSLQAGPGIMPSFTTCTPGSNVPCLSQKELNQISDFLATLK